MNFFTYKHETYCEFHIPSGADRSTVNPILSTEHWGALPRCSKCGSRCLDVHLTFPMANKDQMEWVNNIVATVLRSHNVTTDGFTTPQLNEELKNLKLPLYILADSDGEILDIHKGTPPGENDIEIPLQAFNSVKQMHTTFDKAIREVD